MKTWLVRTIVPLVVGWLLSLPIAPFVTDTLGLTSEQVTQAVTAAVIALYVIAARVLEVYVSPRFGVLLGLPRTVIYAGTAKDGLPSVVTTLPPVDGGDAGGSV